MAGGPGADSSGRSTTDIVAEDIAVSQRSRKRINKPARTESRVWGWTGPTRNGGGQELHFFEPLVQINVGLQGSLLCISTYQPRTSVWPTSQQWACFAFFHGPGGVAYNSRRHWAPVPRKSEPRNIPGLPSRFLHLAVFI